MINNTHAKSAIYPLPRTSICPPNNLPNCPITYLPKKPVPPKTVAVIPLWECLPPGPYRGLKGAANLDEIIFLKLLLILPEWKLQSCGNGHNGGTELIK
mgnify:CR=1